MKKFVIVLILGLVSIISFSSCNHTEYIMVQGSEVKLIEEKDDYTAYRSAFIDYCIGKAFYDLYENPFMKNDKYDFVLWKITYNSRFKNYVKREYNRSDNIYEIINHIINYSYDEANKKVKKYNLSLNIVENNLTPEDIERIFNYCYSDIYNKFSNN